MQWYDLYFSHRRDVTNLTWRYEYRYDVAKQMAQRRGQQKADFPLAFDWSSEKLPPDMLDTSGYLIELVSDHIKCALQDDLIKGVQFEEAEVYMQNSGERLRYWMLITPHEFSHLCFRALYECKLDKSIRHYADPYIEGMDETISDAYIFPWSLGNTTFYSERFVNCLLRIKTKGYKAIRLDKWYLSDYPQKYELCPDYTHHIEDTFEDIHRKLIE